MQTLLALPLLCAHRIVVNSRFSRSVLTDAIPRLARRSNVVYNGVSLAQDVPPAAEVIDGPLRVLYVGRLSPRKGPDIAASALREVRRMGVDAELDIVGSTFPGYEWFSAQLREHNQDLVDASVLRFHDFADDTTDALSGAHVVVVPSTVPEPFGNTAVEAMLAGRPVVVSRSGGLPEAVAGCLSAETVDAGSVEELAAALVRVRDDWEGIRRAATDQRSRVEERFSPDGYRRAVLSAVRAE
jgi:glycosyltransferase involved in cell wall biosynthesis